MRHDQADVADGATHGHSQPGQQRGGNVDDQAHARHVHAKMHRLFFSGEEQVQIGSGGVNCASGNEETNTQEPIDAPLKRSGEIAHQPKGEATEVPGERAHEEHDDGGDERGGDDATEEKRGAVNLARAAAEKIDGGDGSGGSEEGTHRSQQRREYRRKREVGFDNEREDGAETRTAGNTEDVGVRERISKQRLKAGASNGERSTDNDSEENARKTDILDDQDVVAGDVGALVQQDVP